MTGLAPVWLTYYVVGYLLAIVGPILPISGIGVLLWQRVAPGALSEHRRDLPLIVGAVERTLYVAALGAGFREFVAVWLGLKVIGAWRGWSDDRELKTPSGDTVKVHPRSTVNIFLIGSGLSLLNAAAGAAFIRLASDDQVPCAWAVAGAVTAGTWGLWAAVAAGQKRKA